MFTRRTKFTVVTNPPVPRARVAAIAAQKPPARYLDEGEQPGRPERKPVFRRGAAILPDGETIDVLIRNISAGGFRIHHESRKPLAGRILLTEPTTPIHCWADLVWQRGAYAGFRIAS